LFGLVNVYAPCDSRGKQELWARLCNFLSHQTLLAWCVCGDFNDVRSEEERRGHLRVGRSDVKDKWHSFQVNGWVVLC
jgi:hypothetical protein